MRIVIEADAVRMEAKLWETDTAREIYQALPMEAEVMTWGEELYFKIPVKMDLDETARETVEAGDLGYWPTGTAMCIFFGPTPISGPGEIRPASAVNIIGRLRGEFEVLKKIHAGMDIKIDKHCQG